MTLAQPKSDLVLGQRHRATGFQCVYLGPVAAFDVFEITGVEYTAGWYWEDLDTPRDYVGPFDCEEAAAADARRTLFFGDEPWERDSMVTLGLEGRG